MKSIVATALLTSLLIAPALAEPAPCKAPRAGQVDCRKPAVKVRPQQESTGISERDKAALDAARARSTLNSIEDELRRRGAGR